MPLLLYVEAPGWQCLGKLLPSSSRTHVFLSRCPTLLCGGFNGLVGKGHRHPRPCQCRVAKSREEPKSRKVLKLAASSLMMRCASCSFLLLHLGAALVSLEVLISMHKLIVDSDCKVVQFDFSRQEILQTLVRVFCL